jgi:hypothetical protein
VQTVAVNQRSIYVSQKAFFTLTPLLQQVTDSDAIPTEADI